MTRPGIEVTRLELNRKPGEIMDKALSRPVVITTRSRPTHVLLSVADYQELTKNQQLPAVRLPLTGEIGIL